MPSPAPGHAGIAGIAGLTRLTGVTAGSADSSYGLGLFLVESRCGEVVGHHGEVDGFLTKALQNPRLDRTVVDFVNTDSEPAAVAAWLLTSEALCFD